MSKFGKVRPRAGRRSWPYFSAEFKSGVQKYASLHFYQRSYVAQHGNTAHLHYLQCSIRLGLVFGVLFFVFLQWKRAPQVEAEFASKQFRSSHLALHQWLTRLNPTQWLFMLQCVVSVVYCIKSINLPSLKCLASPLRWEQGWLCATGPGAPKGSRGASRAWSRAGPRRGA